MQTENKNFAFESYTESGHTYISITDKSKPWQDPLVVPIEALESLLNGIKGIAYSVKVEV